jgi:hypothetical protein
MDNLDEAAIKHLDAIGRAGSSPASGQDLGDTLHQIGVSAMKNGHFEEALPWLEICSTARTCSEGERRTRRLARWAGSGTGALSGNLRG